MGEAGLVLYPLVGVIRADILQRMNTVKYISTCNPTPVQRNLLWWFLKNVKNPAITVLLSLSLSLFLLTDWLIRKSLTLRPRLMFVPRGVGLLAWLRPSVCCVLTVTGSTLSLGLLSQPALPPLYLGSDPAYNGPRSKLRAAPTAWVAPIRGLSVHQSEDRTPSYDLIYTNQSKLNADI